MKVWLKALGIATVAALLVRLVLIEDYRISSDSMVPELLTGDLVFVNKAAYNLRFPFSSFRILSLGDPKPGEVVAFSLPEKVTTTFVKRVVAHGGDTIEIRSGQLLRNGVTVEGTPLTGAPDYGPIDVPLGHFFVLGDNWKDSIDSRAWGPIPNTCLKGRVGLVWLSVGQGAVLRPKRTGHWVNHQLRS